ncbi:MAG: ABC transporter ATP-binding protein [Planctomycetes bacterium]|nr:ABC transporter ATP-binding protein [Planctomycetota bacterium]NBY03158.1 ABC transporter ATP-binding protein [Planctomycetota bacterium]
MSISPNLKTNIKLRSGVPVTSITGKSLCKSFGEGEMRTTAVNDVSIEIKQGEVALMMGPSGSGKTTLLAILSGLLKPDSGKVTALGQDLWALNEREREHFRLKHCSFIFQGYNLFSSLTARQQLEIVAQWGDGASSREARKKADEILDILGLLKKAHLRPGELSGGEKQRVAIGRALIKNPDFCFADEPTSALDWAHGEQVIDILRSAAHDRGCTVLIVAHDARVIPYADKIFYLEDGKMIDDDGKSIHKTYGKMP